MKLDSRIYIAGHRGLVGSALMRRLKAGGYTNLITRSHLELDLTNQVEVQKFFTEEKPEFVFLAAAKVGGILANDTYPAEFVYENLAIQTNVIHEAWRAKVKRLLFLGSSCIYPRDCPQPIKEEYLLTGPLESTNRAYAIAKIAGIEMCAAYNTQYGARYLAVMPTNLYGQGDNYNLESSHVIPALIRKFHEAKMNEQKNTVVWGTGKPYREFLFSDELANACIFLINLEAAKFDILCNEDRQRRDERHFPILNVGVGTDITIEMLASMIRDVVQFKGDIIFDTSKPDGTMRKVLDVSMLNQIGWSSTVSLADGLVRSYQSYVANGL